MPNQHTDIDSTSTLAFALWVLFWILVTFLTHACAPKAMTANRSATITDTLPDGRVLTIPVVVGSQSLSKLRPLPAGVSYDTTVDNVVWRKQGNQVVIFGSIGKNKAKGSVTGDNDEVTFSPVESTIKEQDNNTVQGDQTRIEQDDSSFYDDWTWWQWGLIWLVGVVVLTLVAKFLIR